MTVPNIRVRGGSLRTEIIARRPPWNKVYEGYPKNKNDPLQDESADAIFPAILGEQYDKNIFSNACATRVSLGLLNAGMNVKPAFKIINKSHPYFGKGFQSSAKGLQVWLTQIWGKADIVIKGPTTIATVNQAINGRNGIYIILGGFAGGVTGHSTLWIGEQGRTIGHDYIDYGGDVYFWELK